MTDEPRRQNFLLYGWYFARQDDWQDIVDFAEGRTDDPFV
jgi:hypothetical protein